MTRALLSLFLCGLLTSPLFPQTPTMRGFLLKEVGEEQRIEQQAQAVPDAARLRQYLEFMAGEPHNAGSPRSKVVAEYVLGMFKEWGLDAQIEELEALMPYPGTRQVEVVSPKPFVAKLKEPPVPQ